MFISVRLKCLFLFTTRMKSLFFKMMVFRGSFIGGNYITRTEIWRTELVNIRDPQWRLHLISPREGYRKMISLHQKMSFWSHLSALLFSSCLTPKVTGNKSLFVSCPFMIFATAKRQQHLTGAAKMKLVVIFRILNDIIIIYSQ